MIQRPKKWTTPNWVKNFTSWMLGFTDSDGEPADERSGYDYGNEMPDEGSPDHPQFVSEEERKLNMEIFSKIPL